MYLNAAAALAALTTASNAAISALDCPQFKSIDQSQFSKFPGYTKSYDGYAPEGDGL